ncbi:MAG TPA: hypothetical protein VGG39_01000 [Polyangiaceae bacterium]|jgi:hypothetical protein
MKRSAWGAILAAAVVAAACGSSKQGSAPGGGSKDGGTGSSSGSGDDGSPSFGDDSGTTGFGDGGHPNPTNPVTVNDCPGPISASMAASLQVGGPVDPAMKWLYPFDGTVFPGGITGPVLQWTPQSGGADGVYVHMHSTLFDYKGCFGATNPMQIPVPDAVWASAWAQSTGANDPLKVELTTIAGTTVSGPITESWTFALGSLKGLVYYNTYTSPQVNNNGAVMVIQPGAAKPSPFLVVQGTSPTGPCISCHSVSANGAMIVAQRHKYPPGLVDSESYDLLKTPTPNTSSPLASTTTDDWGFSAVYPDGSRLLTDGQTAQTGNVFPAAAGNNPGMEGPKPSQMYDPNTGKTIASSGLPQHVMMPSFSPDGTKVVFNDIDNGGGHTLSVMDFDASSNTFSSSKQIFKDTGAYPGWPFFTPDSKSVIFVDDSSSNFASTTNPPLNNVASGDLYLVDVASSVAHALDAANGLSANGSTYLPYGTRDQHLNFYPTVSPVAAGGYFWVFFTSRRNYGNILVDPSDKPPSKKIWVAAIAIGGEPGLDASHPAFYLPGQELASGNIRAFATLAPCKQNGQSCTSGIDCCGGACNAGSCGAPSGCSSADDKCTTSADCCSGAGLQCINGFCAEVVQ